VFVQAMLNDDGDRFPFFFLNLFVALMAAESVGKLCYKILNVECKRGSFPANSACIWEVSTSS
jgi:hypothetical protein